MPGSIPNSEDRLVGEAASFAARAHVRQLRKDGQTPYVSHPFRVCLVLRNVFGIEDRQALMAAILHDTIEDTTTDFDDLAQRFGTEVAQWVACLTKESRLPEEERETAYCKCLATSAWQVKACKLADVYDNLLDATQLSEDKRYKAHRKSRRYLDALKGDLPAPVQSAWEKVDALLRELQ
jgi:guanosine-3',5'-bis(diphosphate) 3'-pyrophosphohydrolase